MTYLVERFHQANATDEYARIKSAAESAAKDWRWATHEMFHLEPYFHELHQCPRGRWVSQSGDPHSRRLCHHGISATGETVLIRQLVEFPGQFYETFFVHKRHEVDEYHYDYHNSKSLISLARMRYSCDGFPQSYETVSATGSCNIEYTLGGSKVIAATCVYDSEHEGAGFREYYYSYDDLGRLYSIVGVYDVADTIGTETQRIVYVRPRKNESLSELSKLIKEKLVAEIPTSVRGAVNGNSIYSVILLYHTGFEPLPPLLVPGLESERLNAIERYGQKARDHIWNPTMSHHFEDPALTIRDQECIAACRLFNQEVSTRDNDRLVVRILNEIAAKLMDNDWSGVTRTSDFVVFPIDAEGNKSIAQAMKRCVPSAMRKRLRSNGLL